MKRGFIQVYTGDGKGKTTAAFGLAVRALGSGMKVYIGQFMKMGNYSEIKAMSHFENIIIEQYGSKRNIGEKIETGDIKKAGEGLIKVKEALASNKFDVIILDEINIAAFLKLVKIEDILDLMKNKPENLELVLTGRYADRRIIEAADLVTEMSALKHYYSKGIMARIGIER